MNIDEKKELCANWFEELRNLICAEFEKIEQEFALNNSLNNSLNDTAKFQQKKWQRTDKSQDGGYGEMSMMKGKVFEKVGVNFSRVYGEFSEEFRKEIPGALENPQFYATGISLVAHMCSPLVPAVHMNTRFIVTQKSWFGGGGDLNPMYEDPKDTADFHQAFKKACDISDANYYPKFKKWCDEYFFIKHRGVARGVGGIFYDYLNNGDEKANFMKDFNFTQNVGKAFLEIYPQIVRRHMYEKFNDEQRHHQLKKRGLYTEFNLVYDRGTRFGLMTGGNTEAILMSLPPIAVWE
jgi:coproporphyrinogen III oxidase